MQLVTAATLVQAGRTVGRGLRAHRCAGAGSAFSVWWYALGAYLALEGSLALAIALGEVPLSAFVAWRHAALVAVGTAVWGITYYVGYLWTGWARLRAPLAVFFAALVASLVAYHTSLRPLGPVEHSWLVGTQFARDVSSPVYLGVVLAFSLPPLAASLGYLGLWRVAKRRDQRYRMSLVCASIALFAGTGLVVRLGESELLMFLNLVLGGLGTALCVHLAFHPPRSLRVWLADARAAAPPALRTLPRQPRRLAPQERPQTAPMSPALSRMARATVWT